MLVLSCYVSESRQYMRAAFGPHPESWQYLVEAGDGFTQESVEGFMERFIVYSNSLGGLMHREGFKGASGTVSRRV